MRGFQNLMGTLAIILSLGFVTGCDAVQEIVDGKKDEAPAVVAPQNAAQPNVAQAPTTQQPVTPGTQPVVVDPNKVLADFLALKPNQINEGELAKIANVPAAAAQIGEIDMTQAQMTTGGIALLSKFPSLKSVKLDSVMSLKAGAFQGLGNAKTLTHVSVSRTLMNAQDLAAITQLPELQVLGMNSSKGVSAAGFAALANAKKLSVLDISATLSGDSVTPTLARLPITKLEIYSTAFTDQGLAQVAQIATLQELNVSFTRVTGNGFKVFRNHNLKSLSAGSTKFGVEGLAAIKGMKNLETLVLYQAGLVGTLKQMNVFGTFPNLKHLNLGKNGISDLGLKSLFVRCRELETLNISHHLMVTNNGLVFLKNLKKLKTLDVTNTGCNEQGAVFMQQQIPGLEVLYR
jgi:hypothetical protein